MDEKKSEGMNMGTEGTNMRTEGMNRGTEGMNRGTEGEEKRQDGSGGFIMQESTEPPHSQWPREQPSQGQTSYGQQPTQAAAGNGQQPPQGQPTYGQQSEQGTADYSQQHTFYGQQAPREQASYGQTPPQQGMPHLRKRLSKRAKTVIAVVVAVVLAAGCGFGGAMGALYLAPSLIPTANNNVVIKPSDSISTGEAVAEKVMPSVVGISTTEQQNVPTFFGQMTQQVKGVGTGIIVDAKGYILTNSHVVNDGKTQTLTVQLYDGREVPGTVLWNDPIMDLAIVKVSAPNLQPAELGNSEDMKVGSYAAAIGNPMGLEYARSMSQGIISGLNRNVTIQGTDGRQDSTMEGLIQTDASINSGNSGGPLLNDKGQVIGINTAKAASSEGMGFAIPINTAKPIVDEIKEKGEFQRSYIGIGGMSVSNVMQMYPNVKLDSKTGVYIIQVYTNSPATAAGLKEGDIIVGINDDKINNMQELTSKLFQHRPGDKVTLEIVRDNTTLKKDVTLTASADHAVNMGQQGETPHQ